MPAVMSPDFRPYGVLRETSAWGWTEVRASVMQREVESAAAILEKDGSSVRFPEVTPISAQVGGSCVANAFCDGEEYLQAFQNPGGQVVQISRSAAYYWSRCRHGAQHQDGGTYASAMATQLLTVGVVPESEWAHTEEHILQRVPDRLIMLAADHRIEGCVEVPYTGSRRADQVEWYLRAGLPVVVCNEITRSQFGDPNPSDVIGPAQGDIWGAHATLLVGVRVLVSGDREFLLRNSWGRGWGDNGYIWVSQGFLSSSFEVFALTKAVDLVKP